MEISIFYNLINLRQQSTAFRMQSKGITGLLLILILSNSGFTSYNNHFDFNKLVIELMPRVSYLPIQGYILCKQI